MTGVALPESRDVVLFAARLRVSSGENVAARLHAAAICGKAATVDEAQAAATVWLSISSSSSSEHEQPHGGDTDTDCTHPGHKATSISQALRRRRCCIATAVDAAGAEGFDKKAARKPN